MDPPGNILLDNTVTQDSANPPSLSNLNDTDGNQSSITSSDPVPSLSSTLLVPFGPTPKRAPPLITHIDNDDDFGPRYKDQTNSVAYDGNVHIDSKRTPNIASTNVAVPTTNSKQDNGPNYKDQVNDSSNEVFLSSNRVSNPTTSSKQDNGPNYKDQVNDSSNEVFLSSNRVSNSNPANSNSNSNSNNSDSAQMVPIVHGVLIPPEMLTDEERRSSGQEVSNRPPVGSDTYPHTTNTSFDVHTSNNRKNQSENVNEKKFLQSSASSSSKDEQMFWMKIIFGAIFFNTLLVAAVIVGTFCGIGLCSSGSEPASTSIIPPPPTLSPTKITISASPSLSPSSIQTLVLTPPIAGDSYFSNPPSGAPSYVPSKTPIFIAPPTVTDSSRGTKLIAFIVPAVILEFIIVLICLYYYYQRRSQRQSKAEIEPPQNEEKEYVNESLPPEDSRSVLTA